MYKILSVLLELIALVLTQHVAVVFETRGELGERSLSNVILHNGISLP